MATTEEKSVQVLVQPWIRDALKEKSGRDRTTIQALVEKAVVRAYGLKRNGAKR